MSSQQASAPMPPGPPPAAPPKKRRGPLLWVLLGGGCLVLPVLLIIIAAVALPAFLGYVRRSKTAEATANLDALYLGASEYVLTHGRLPPPIPRTPAFVGFVGCGEKHHWPIDADPRWAELGFAPVEPLYYSYEVAPDGAGGIAFRAYADLDCDGIDSLFELSASLGLDGSLERAPGFFIERELE